MNDQPVSREDVRMLRVRLREWAAVLRERERGTPLPTPPPDLLDEADQALCAAPNSDPQEGGEDKVTYVDSRRWAQTPERKTDRFPAWKEGNPRPMVEVAPDTYGPPDCKPDTGGDKAAANKPPAISDDLMPETEGRTVCSNCDGIDPASCPFCEDGTAPLDTDATDQSHPTPHPDDWTQMGSSGNSEQGE